MLSESGRSPGGRGEVVYLRGGSQVDDGVQGDIGFKLVQQPGVPVLVDAPLRVQQVAALKQVGRKDVPETGGETVLLGFSQNLGLNQNPDRTCQVLP